MVFGQPALLVFLPYPARKNALRYVCWMLENMNQTIGWLVSTFIAGHMDLAWFVLMLIILSSTKCNRTNMLNLGGVICGSPTLMMVGSCLELACNLSSWLYPPMIVQELSKLGVFWVWVKTFLTTYPTRMFFTNFEHNKYPILWVQTATPFWA